MAIALKTAAGKFLKTSSGKFLAKSQFQTEYEADYPLIMTLRNGQEIEIDTGYVANTAGSDLYALIFSADFDLLLVAETPDGDWFHCYEGYIDYEWVAANSQEYIYIYNYDDCYDMNPNFCGATGGWDPVAEGEWIISNATPLAKILFDYSANICYILE